MALAERPKNGQRLTYDGMFDEAEAAGGRKLLQSMVDKAKGHCTTEEAAAIELLCRSLQTCLKEVYFSCKDSSDAALKAGRRCLWTFDDDSLRAFQISPSVTSSITQMCIALDLGTPAINHEDGHEGLLQLLFKSKNSLTEAQVSRLKAFVLTNVCWSNGEVVPLGVGNASPPSSRADVDMEDATRSRCTTEAVENSVGDEDDMDAVVDAANLDSSISTRQRDELPPPPPLSTSEGPQPLCASVGVPSEANASNALSGWDSQGMSESGPGEQVEVVHDSLGDESINTVGGIDGAFDVKSKNANVGILVRASGKALARVEVDALDSQSAETMRPPPTGSRSTCSTSVVSASAGAPKAVRKKPRRRKREAWTARERNNRKKKKSNDERASMEPASSLKGEESEEPKGESAANADESSVVRADDVAPEAIEAEAPSQVMEGVNSGASVAQPTCRLSANPNQLGGAVVPRPTGRRGTKRYGSESSSGTAASSPLLARRNKEDHGVRGTGSTAAAKSGGGLHTPTADTDLKWGADERASQSSIESGLISSAEGIGSMRGGDGSVNGSQVSSESISARSLEGADTGLVSPPASLYELFAGTMGFGREEAMRYTQALEDAGFEDVESIVDIVDAEELVRAFNFKVGHARRTIRRFYQRFAHLLAGWGVERRPRPAGTGTR